MGLQVDDVRRGPIGAGVSLDPSAPYVLSWWERGTGGKQRAYSLYQNYYETHNLSNRFSVAYCYTRTSALLVPKLLCSSPRQSTGSIWSLPIAQPRFLVYGKTGWIGGKIGKILEAKGASWTWGHARMEDRAAVAQDLDQVCAISLSKCK